MVRSAFSLILACAVSIALCAAFVGSLKKTVDGLYKAVARDNSPEAPDIDGKLDFRKDGTFTFTRKDAETTFVASGTYDEKDDVVILSKAKGESVWPKNWKSPAVMTIDTNGDLELDGLTYTASLIGKAFKPGLYMCAAAPINHYYFSPVGGYKYKGIAVSTGEYWVEKTTDSSGQESTRLILNILRIDGKRVSFHQIIPLNDDGGFTLEGKYKYSLKG